MVFKLGKYVIFYRHFFYGSALGIGTSIGGYNNLQSPIIQICLIVSILLMSTSFFVTYMVNKYPKEFHKELNDVSDERE